MYTQTSLVHGVMLERDALTKRYSSLKLQVSVSAGIPTSLTGRQLQTERSTWPTIPEGVKCNMTVFKLIFTFFTHVTWSHLEDRGPLSDPLAINRFCSCNRSNNIKIVN